jgi:hypothetical protein
MDLQSVHIDLVRYELMRSKRDEITIGVIFMEAEGHESDLLYREYFLHRDTYQNDDTIIGAYFVNSDFFYYLEWVYGSLFIVRRTDTCEKRLRLTEKEVSDYYLDKDSFYFGDSAKHVSVCALIFMIDFQQRRL